MKIKLIWLAALLVVVSVGSVLGGTRSKEELAQMAISADPAAQAEALKDLRALGREGLDALVQVYAGEIAKFSESGAGGGDEWQRIAFALDSVAAQKDAYASNLFWFTDLEEAGREARKTNKPILSLRLLGNLNEEFSCANSRFFRSLLYSNAEVSKFLRENYVLHWKSVRPAPKVTIDFGDGRRIERTLTGNSIHYILDENGAIIDALPGLYAPADFLKYLKAGAEIRRTVKDLPTPQKETAMQRFRKKMFDEITTKRRQLLEFAQVRLAEPKFETPTGAKPDALEAAPLAVTKMSTEMLILNRISDNFLRYAPQIDLGDWRKLAAYYVGGTKFDESSVRFIKRQNRQTGLTDAQFAGLLSNLKDFVALDTTRNDFLFHTKLYEWLNQPGARPPLEIESFNSRVYAELFKTPESDKWLGLYSPDVYTALDGNGVIK
jgi:hypothetical protein